LYRKDTDAVRKIPEDRFLLIVDSTSAILSAAEQLGQQIRGDEEDRDIYNFLPGLMAIPQELEDGFKTLATKLYPDLSTISLHLGIDTAVYHFNKLTKTPDEVACIRNAQLINELAMVDALELLRPGVRQTDLSAALPLDYTFTPSDLGAHTFAVVLTTAATSSASPAGTSPSSQAVMRRRTRCRP